jgi:predicted house-cleaning noncanonical NTP pyrophosphatase (MazG superfamily)
MPEKLVRDKIPEIIRAAGGQPQLRRATQGERLGLLLKKLQEESDELEREPSLEECADVLEVLLAIATELGFTEQALLDSAASKTANRGAFQQGYVLEIPGESQ